MKITLFKLAFGVYVLVCAAISLLCTIFLFLDHGNKTVYSNIVVFIIGKWSGFLVAKQAKSRSKEARKLIAAVTPPENRV